MKFWYKKICKRITLIYTFLSPHQKWQKNKPCQKKISVVQKLWPHKAFKNLPTSLKGVKNALHRKYGFIILLEKVLRSRLRKIKKFQNIIGKASFSQHFYLMFIHIKWVKLICVWSISGLHLLIVHFKKLTEQIFFYQRCLCTV